MPKIKTLERKRFSILTDDLTHCYVCTRPKQQLHEVFYGKNRKNSMIYGCVVPLCYECHEGNNGVHHNPDLNLKLRKECQKRFNKVYPDLDFISIFYENYL
jgi:hypothetical protein